MVVAIAHVLDVRAVLLVVKLLVMVIKPLVEHKVLQVVLKVDQH